MKNSRRRFQINNMRVVAYTSLIVALSWPVISFSAIFQTKVPLYIIVGQGVEDAELFAEIFEQETGIHTEVMRLPTLSVGTINLDLDSNYVFISGRFSDLIDARQDGKVRKYVTKNSRNLCHKCFDKEGAWTALYLEGIGFAVNNKVLAAEGLKPPARWSDLLQTQFRSEIILPYPSTSETGYAILTSILNLFGNEALSYWRELVMNVHHFTKSPVSCVTQISLGEAAVCLASIQEVVKRGPKRYIDFIYPEEGIGYKIVAMSILGLDKNPVELAQNFVDWATSESFQQRASVNARIAANMQAWEHGFNLALYDPEEWYSVKRERFLKIISSITPVEAEFP